MPNINTEDYISMGYFCRQTNRTAQVVYRWVSTGAVDFISMESGDDKNHIYIHKKEISRCFKPTNSQRFKVPDEEL